MSQQTIRALERELATIVAISDIETCCNRCHHSGGEYGWWYDIASTEMSDQPVVERAVRYLGLRKRIKRHPDNPGLIMIKAAP